MRKPRPLSEASLNALASAVYGIWRERKATARLASRRNARGLEFAPELPSYENLSVRRRDQIVSWIVNSEIVDELCDAVEHALKWWELTASDITVGTPVGLTPEPGQRPKEGDAFEPIGRVVEWEVLNPHTGRLDSITVRCSDGTLRKYAASELAIVKDR